MPRNWFDEILQVITDAVNAQFKVAILPGNTVCLDESMVK